MDFSNCVSASSTFPIACSACHRNRLGVIAKGMHLNTVSPTPYPLPALQQRKRPYCSAEVSGTSKIPHKPPSVVPRCTRSARLSWSEGATLITRGVRYETKIRVGLALTPLLENHCLVFAPSTTTHIGRLQPDPRQHVARPRTLNDVSFSPFLSSPERKLWANLVCIHN